LLFERYICLSGQLEYIIQSVYHLSIITYHDYDHEGSFNYLQDILTYGYSDSLDTNLINYHFGISKLHSDVYEMDEAMSALNKAIDLVREENSTSSIRTSRLFELYDYQAYYYYLLDDYKQAIASLKKGMTYINPLDVESVFMAKFMITDYYLYNGDTDLAITVYDEVKGLYPLTSELFKNYYTQNDMDFKEADIAYTNEDYQKAADLFQTLYSSKPDFDAMDEALTTKSNIIDFKDRMITEQITIYEELDQVRSGNIQLLKRTVFAISTLTCIAILALVTVLLQRRKLHTLSITDHLTKLNNRYKIMDHFEKIKPGESCVALLDLDHFKRINDTYGHLYGDIVLEKIAKTITDTIRTGDYVGRYGGEEFLIMINSDDVNIAKDIIENIIYEITELTWDYPELQTTVSIGLVYSCSVTGDDLLREADKQMYLSKSNGRNQYNYKFVTE